MEKYFALSLVFFILLLVSFFPLNANAETDNRIKSVVLNKDQIINKDYFAAGESVTLSGTVNGDAYIAGGNVIIEGVVNGDLLAAGGTINIRGKVRDDIRVVGGQIIISGEVGRNITTVGGSVTIADSAKIGGSLTAGAGSLSIFAPIGKEANIGAGQITIGNIITGDVTAGVGQLTLTPLSQINGNLTYWSDIKAQIDPGATVGGKITHNLPPKPNAEKTDVSKSAGSLLDVSIAFTILSYFSTLIIGLLLIKFFPIYTGQITSVILKKPLQSLGVGFLSILSAPFIFVLLMVTIIGIPLGLILLTLFFISICLAKIFIGIALGQKILSALNKKTSNGWALIIGLSAYYFLVSIPIIGSVFWIVAGLTGLGAILLSKKQLYSAFRSKNLI